MTATHSPSASPTGAPGTAMDLWAPPTGFHRFSDETTIDFQCNRWAESIGPRAVGELRSACGRRASQAQWIDALLDLAASARAQGRAVDAAFYERGAEFFLTAADPRKPALRQQFVKAMQEAYRVEPTMVPYGASHLPAYEMLPSGPEGHPGEPVSTWVLFGGFDSYIEEFLPLMAAVAKQGRRVIAFDGPGQGAALEDEGLPLTPHWEKPVAAVLDHFGLEEATLVGISLGGELVIRAAAFEPRVRRAVAWNAMDDFLETLLAHVPLPRALVLRGPGRLVDALVRRSAAVDPLVEWGLWQGMHVTGTISPAQFLRAASRLHTRQASPRVTADVLLLQGAQDHYVPYAQTERQARALAGARSITTRVFTSVEQAAEHCQVGNRQLAVRAMLSWEDSLMTPAP